MRVGGPAARIPRSKDVRCNISYAPDEVELDAMQGIKELFKLYIFLSNCSYDLRTVNSR